MAKSYNHTLYPSPSSSSSSNASSCLTSSTEIYTLWMKSLVLNGNGCTIYDSNGEIVYRVDNYDQKGCKEVYLMDQGGKALYKILRKKLRVFGRWEAYRYDDSNGEEKMPRFRVKKACGILKGSGSFGIEVMGCGRENKASYKIEILKHQSVYRIMDMAGGLVAQVQRKHTVSGVMLGEDVMTLAVEPNTERLLVMGLVVVCCLINH
ncbi:protein LURP-one-related 11-like [Elaeis guineensis]|uniref:Protein LURP-one-related 11-like n=1 Tax=Elaeis guineensis var. tenera TaxID=51953 RepID=A0A6I9RUB7_ELAGV|nr:protein LURP-one-related 11-like [Elaeis guineensis]